MNTWHGLSGTRIDRDWDITSGVGLTALAVAAVRAVETARPDRLCADPYADALVAAAQPLAPLPTRLGQLREQGWDAQFVAVWQAMAAQIGVRARFFDDYLSHALWDRLAQVVILAAGLDTRAARLTWPAHTAVFEIDQPRVLAFKDAVTAAQHAPYGCERHPIGVDLRDDWPPALRQPGFDSTQPTAWLVEGLLPDLPEPAERDLFAHISALSAPNSRVGLTDSHDLSTRMRVRGWPV